MNPAVQQSLETLEIELLLTAIVRVYGYDFRDYAPASLRRRIHVAMQRERVASVSALQDRVLRFPDAMERFLKSISIHVTAMFRDPSFYRVLRSNVIPVLRTYPFIRVWLAGCSTGEEVYSMAILLEEEGVYDRCRIYATDLSQSVLKRASRGVYPLERMRENTANYLRGGGTRDFSNYYTADEHSVLFRDRLRRNVVFSQHNLASDGVFNEFNLVLCRNVLIYFNNDLRARAHRLLANSLCHFGILGLGKKESLDFSVIHDSFEDLDRDVRLFRKVR